MKVKLIMNVPVGKEHGMIKGKEIKVSIKNIDGINGYWVKGNTGEDVKLLPHEFEEIG